MKIVFMGSPAFAVPALESLNTKFEIVGVVTQPDRKAGRGRKISRSAVKDWAEEAGLEIIQPQKLPENESLQQLQAWGPELIVVAAYGQILKPDVLELPKLGSINVHASLLPRWRGASPVQAAILHGDQTTGITIMKMDPGMDTGPILVQERLPIPEQATGGELSELLSELGGSILVSALEGYISGELKAQPQNEDEATYAPLLKKVDGRLDFEQSANFLARQVRAYQPWPGTFFYWHSKRIAVEKTGRIAEVTGDPGAIGIHDSYPTITTSKGALVLRMIRLEGKRSMSGDQFLLGQSDFVGSRVDPLI